MGGEGPLSPGLCLVAGYPAPQLGYGPTPIPPPGPAPSFSIYPPHTSPSGYGGPPPPHPQGPSASYLPGVPPGLEELAQVSWGGRGEVFKSARLTPELAASWGGGGPVICSRSCPRAGCSSVSREGTLLYSTVTHPRSSCNSPRPRVCVLVYACMSVLCISV